MQPSTHAQTDWPAADAGGSSLPVFFHFGWQILRAGHHAALTWFAWTSATGWLLWLISSNVVVLLCRTVFTNILIAVIDWRWRSFFSKWLRTTSAYELRSSLKFIILFFFLLVCAFHAVHCLSSIQYISLFTSWFPFLLLVDRLDRISLHLSAWRSLQSLRIMGKWSYRLWFYVSERLKYLGTTWDADLSFQLKMRSSTSPEGK